MFGAKGGLGGRGTCCVEVGWVDGACDVCCVGGACCVAVPVELGPRWPDADMGVSDREGVRLRLGFGLGLCGARGGVSWYGKDAWLAGCPKKEFTASTTSEPMIPQSASQGSSSIRAEDQYIACDGLVLEKTSFADQARSVGLRRLGVLDGS